jgi:hypothetical protein
MTPVKYAVLMFTSLANNLLVTHVKPEDRAPHWNSQDAQVQLTRVLDLATLFLRSDGVLMLHHYRNDVDTTRIIHTDTCHSFFSKNIKYWNCMQVIPTTIGKEHTVRALTYSLHSAFVVFRHDLMSANFVSQYTREGTTSSERLPHRPRRSASVVPPNSKTRTST